MKIELNYLSSFEPRHYGGVLVVYKKMVAQKMCYHKSQLA